MMQLREQHRKQLQQLRTAERKRKSAKENRKTSGKQQAAKEDVEAYLRKVNSDSNRNKSLPPSPRIYDYPEPSEPFDENLPTFKELQEVVKIT